MLKIGDKAPDFILKNERDEDVKLNDFLGKKVVLYFYQRDDTPGCSKQALLYKELINEFIDKNTVIIGISKDNVSSHLKFKEKYNLPFILLADPTHEVIELYGQWKQKFLYGKPYMGTMRATFLINEEGVIIDIFEKVKPEKDASNVLLKI